MERATAGDALEVIGVVETSALKFVGDIMEYNAQCTNSLMESLLEGEKRAHEETKELLREANRRLDLISRRIAWLFGEDLYEEEG